MDISISTAVQEENKRVQQLDELAESVHAYGYRISKNVKYDGNCFFHAIGSLIEVDGFELRTSLHRYLTSEELPAGLKVVITDDLLQNLENQNEETENDVVCKAMAEFLQRDVTVITRYPDGRNVFNTFTSDNAVHTQLSLGHVKDCHFVPLESSKGEKTERDAEVRGKKRKITDFFGKVPTDIESPTTSTDKHKTDVKTSIHHNVCVEESKLNSSDIAVHINTTLCNSDRAKLIEGKWTPQNFTFPQNEQNRRYNPDWENDYKWLAYSKSLRGAFCKFCIAFSNTCGKYNPEFITKPFKDWKNATGAKRGALFRHQNSELHNTAVKLSQYFIERNQGEQDDIAQFTSKAYKEKIEHNREILLSILDVIISLSQRGIALRGSWNKTDGIEDSNFRHFIAWKSNYDKKLKVHIKSAPKNATYLSPQTQNELISSLESVMRDSILSLANNAQYISVMADETTDVSVKEQLSICLRYVDPDTFEIREDLIGFVEVAKTDSDTLSKAIVSNLLKWGVDMEKVRGQGYDGAANMAGVKSGVHVRIKEQYPKAKYFTHCSSHRLNLVIAASCTSVPEIRNMMTSIQKITFFLNNSAKRKAIVADALKDTGVIPTDSKADEDESVYCTERNTINTLCETRWGARHESLDVILSNYKAVLTALDMIERESSGTSSYEASSYINSLRQFPIIYSAVTCHYFLGFTKTLSLALQSKSCDLLAAYEMTQVLRETLANLRINPDTPDNLYERAQNLAQSVDVELKKPRTTGRQTKRANAGDNECLQEYFKVNYCFPFLDHLINHLETRFPAALAGVFRATLLLPAKVHLLQSEDVRMIKEEFTEDLPSPSTFDQEILLWQTKHSNSKDDRNTSLQETLRECSSDFYPNIHSILMLLVSLPVGTCTSERSFSALRRLKTWSRSTMCAERLNGLGMVYVHRDRDIDRLEVLRRWDDSGHRRIALAFQKN